MLQKGRESIDQMFASMAIFVRNILDIKVLENDLDPRKALQNDMKLLNSKGTSEMFNRETMNRKLYEWIRMVFNIY